MLMFIDIFAYHLAFIIYLIGAIDLYYLMFLSDYTFCDNSQGQSKTYPL